MTDAHDGSTTPEPGEAATGDGPAGSPGATPPGGPGWLPPSDPAWIIGGSSGGAVPPAPASTPPGGAPSVPGGPPSVPGGELAPTAPGETPPAGTSPQPGSGWGTAGAGWVPHGGAGWVPPGSAGWAPPGGGGWAPPGGGGWVPPGGTWAPYPGPAPRPGKHRSSGVVLLITGLAVIALLLGGGVGYLVRGPSSSTPVSATPAGGSTFGSRFGSGTATPGAGRSGTSGSSTSGAGGSISSASGSPSNLSAIASKVDPGLVDINTTLGYDNAQAAGTGMVLTSSGEVLTNNHVIDGATTISATDIGNGKTYTASVVGYDRTKDVAVIQLHGASGLKTVSLGNSSQVAVGEGVVGIGNAGGAGGTPSVAGGSVTALDQSITASDAGDGTVEHLTGLIETNAGIQPGDSGGPLVTTSDQVVGMDTAASAAEGFSIRASADQAFSIPIDEAATLAKQIVAGNASSTVHIGATAFLGVKIQPSSSQAPTVTIGGGGASATPTTLRTTPGSSSSSTAGAPIAGVLSGTPAAQAGLSSGDVITGFAGKAITSATALSNAIGGYHPGAKVQVTWVTSTGVHHTATVTLANGPPD